MSDYGYPSAPAGNPMGQMPPQQPPPVYPKLDVGDVLQTSASLVGRNFVSFVGVATLFAVPGIILNAILAKTMMSSMASIQQAAASGDIAGMLSSFPMSSIIFSIAGGFVNAVLVYMGMGTLMYAAVESLAGRQRPLADVLSHGLKYAPNVAIVAVVLMVAQYLAMLPGGVALGLGAAVAVSTDAAALMCCLMPTGLLMVLVPVVYVAILLFLAIPSAVLEGLGPIAAISRSVELTKGHRGTIFLILFLVGLVVILLAIVLQACTPSMAGELDPATLQFQEPTVFAYVIGVVTEFIMVVLRIVIVGSLASVIYARVRGLKDGVDANAIAQVFS